MHFRLLLTISSTAREMLSCSPTEGSGGTSSLYGNRISVTRFRLMAGDRSQPLRVKVFLQNKCQHFAVEGPSGSKRSADTEHPEEPFPNIRGATSFRVKREIQPIQNLIRISPCGRKGNGRWRLAIPDRGVRPEEGSIEPRASCKPRRTIVTAPVSIEDGQRSVVSLELRVKGSWLLNSPCSLLLTAYCLLSPVFPVPRSSLPPSSQIRAPRSAFALSIPRPHTCNP